jgi:hypothetical protein
MLFLYVGCRKFLINQFVRNLCSTKNTRSYNRMIISICLFGDDTRFTLFNKIY